VTTPALTTATLPIVLGQQAGGGGSMFMLLLFGAMALLLFFSFRKARKAQQEQTKMRTELTPGVEVMTGSGIFGHVVAVNPDSQRVSIEVAPGTTMDVHLQAIAQIVAPDSVAASGAGADQAPAEPVSGYGAPQTRTDDDVDRIQLNGEDHPRPDERP
jgi:preprotein translocase subunit YajC